MKSIFAGRVFGLASLSVAATFTFGAAGGCASTQVLTQGEVGRSGARHFAAPKDTTFAVCVGALTAEGYEIARSDARAGLIETRPQAVHAQGPVTARAYRVTVVPDGEGSRVVAQPILYAGARDISNADVWVLDGPEGERAQWSDLFGVMDAALVTPAATAGTGEAIAAHGATSPSLAKQQPAAPSGSGASGNGGGLTPAGLSGTPGSSSARP